MAATSSSLNRRTPHGCRKHSARLAGASGPKDDFRGSDRTTPSECPNSPSSDGRDLILLQLAIRRLERPDSQHPVGESHSIRAASHPASQRLTGLHESSRSAKWAEAGRKILERLVAEVGVRVRSEQ